MKNTSVGLLISLIIHAVIIYGLLGFMQTPPIPAKPTAVPLNLTMFQPEPKPILKTITTTIPTLTSVIEPKYLTANLALIPLPTIKPKTRHKTVKKVKRKKLKKVRTKHKSRPSKSKTIKVKSKPIKVKPKPKLQIAKPASIVKKVKPKPQITKPAPVKKAKQIKKIIPKINKVKEAERNYRRKLNRLIAQKKTYPRKAKRMGQQGVVRVSFVVLNNGKIRNIKITKSSGSRSLDKAAKKLIQKISGLLPFSKSIKRKQWQFHININYRLNS